VHAIERLRGWFVRDTVERARESASAHSAEERDHINEEAEGVRADRFVMSGDGVAAPTLPIGGADEIGEIFEHDQHAPRDVAP